MVIGFLTGRNKELAALEIECVLAREFAPPSAITIVSQSPLFSHTEEWPTRWGQLPAEWAATTAASTLSNMILALGGTIRIVDLLLEQETETDRPKEFELSDHTLVGLAKYLIERLNLPAGRFELGLSVVGELQYSWLHRLMGSLKQAAQQGGAKLRIVLPDRQMLSNSRWPELSAASVRKNKLVTKGAEIVLIPSGRPQHFYIGLTLAIHNPDRDAWLDRNIPKSDALSGMLPPKLARMLVNIGLGQARSDLAETIILDPFCGNGRVLLEGLLLGQPVQGRDVDAIKVESAKTNIEWLRREGPNQFWWSNLVANESIPEATVFQHDARERWRQDWGQPHVVVSEPWLGPALRSRPNQLEARQYADRVLNILEAALPHLLAERPRRLVLIVPRWLLTAGGELAVTDQIVETCRKQGFTAEIVATVQRPDSFIARDVIVADRPT